MEKSKIMNRNKNYWGTSKRKIQESDWKFARNSIIVMKQN